MPIEDLILMWNLFSAASGCEANGICKQLHEDVSVIKHRRILFHRTKSKVSLLAHIYLIGV
jgi:hypothetical protein